MHYLAVYCSLLFWHWQGTYVENGKGWTQTLLNGNSNASMLGVMEQATKCMTACYNGHSYTQFTLVKNCKDTDMYVNYLV